ncbi:class II fumarate hydratase [Alkalihalophilus pseudofirmus]|uniref:Fumarate hydratase class II n=1 Tax=Alkalihalophilus pseudofirmus TaxID=79885 RepID=A0AAJ2KSK9_ALKPS|nr:class II fumarate hydratase [Alkalihalophilus pseudofirmus]MDV2884066.1 class II fumarate hydratase [Alkalihalophilus pseudofirmus]
MSKRIERDTLGEMYVEDDKLWGAQTQRSLENFPIGKEKIPNEVITAFLHLKKACAIANKELGAIEEEKAAAIIDSIQRLLEQDARKHFPLVVWQTGSGTQSNMNVNEVVARLANESKEGFIHPNDDVNRSQSSNDTFPTAMHVATVFAVEKTLYKEIDRMIETCKEKEQAFQDVVKIGRTHLQDATPLTVAQEISGFRHMLETSKKMIEESLEHVRILTIGGTAVGTGLNAPKGFGEAVSKQLSTQLGTTFTSSTNYFHGLTSHDALVGLHGNLKGLAANLFKIANDIRLLASGPRSGIGEYQLPINEPGSSIMPGKVNPTQAEALTMVCAQVFGNDATVGFAASQGHFQLNVFKPVIIYNVLQSIELLRDGMASFHDRCLAGLEINEDKMKDHLNNSLMLVTALNPHIGYEKAAKIAKLAFDENLTLREAAEKTGYITPEEFDTFVRPENMVNEK